MEAEKDKATKRYKINKNQLIFHNIKLAVQVVAVVILVGYWCFPATVELLQVFFTVLSDWLSLVLKNIFFVFVIVNALIAVIYYVSFQNTTVKNKPDLYDQYFAVSAVPSVTPAAIRAVKVVEVSSKSYRRTRSEKKTTTEEKKKVKTTVEYRRSESEKVIKTEASWRSRRMEGLSSEEFRVTVESFITEKKKMLLRQNGVVQWQGLADQRHDSSRFMSGSIGCVGSYLAISN
ncbi:unnamed protein product [Cochlearia groenlandica]